MGYLGRKNYIDNTSYIGSTAYANIGLGAYISRLSPTMNSAASGESGDGIAINITPGSAVSAVDSNEVMELTSMMTKYLSAGSGASWSVGSSGGGWDGTESVSGYPDAYTKVSIYLIKRSDTGVVDVCFSENGPTTGPSIDGSPIPTAYDHWRWLGWWKTNSVGKLNNVHFYGSDNRMTKWFTSSLWLASSLSSTSYAAQSLSGNMLWGIPSAMLFGGMYASTTMYVWLSQDGVNAKNIFKLKDSNDGINQEHYMADMGASNPVFMPINEFDMEVYYKVDTGNFNLRLHAIRFWR